MPSVVSKVKKSRRMAGSEPMRVFCVTGTKTSSPSKSPSSIQTTSGTSHITGQSDSDSNTSGYLSSSSFESSGEEKRLILNEKKVYQLWEKLGHQQSYIHPGPRNSTPKQNDDSVHKKRFNISTQSGHSMLAIKKNLGGSKLKLKDTSSSSNSSKQMLDSFWDIETTQLHKSKSENDVRLKNRNTCPSLPKTNFKHVQSDSCIRPKNANSYVEHDAGQVVPENNSHSYNRVSKSNDWKRKPFSTLSNSEIDLRLSGESKVTTAPSNFSEHSSLPRYRVKIDNHTHTGSSHLVQKLHRSCADFSEQGRSVDESMTEFLANVDQENLASFLNFYDKVTSDTAYERARRNPNNYEAVYY